MRTFVALVVALSVVGLAVPASAQTIEYLDAKPLTSVVSARLQPVQGGATKVPLITWGGDVATILAETDGIFREGGLTVSLFTENDFKKQVETCLAGETPYLRGTMGMINSAAEVFQRAGANLTVAYQMTWSAGGDAMVVRENIKRPEDLKGKTIALQLYGPHMDYLATILNSAGVPLSSVRIKYLRELTLPKEDTGGKIVDPVSAFAADRTIDAVMCISPDALALTSGGKIGTGASGSVKGARILLTSKTASRVIADVYAVRSDYFSGHRSDVEHFTHALMRGQESLADLLRNKDAQQARYRGLLAKSADMLFGASQATADVEGLLGDCEFVGYQGNVAFFTGTGTTRTLENLTAEIQRSFNSMGLMAGRVPLSSAGFDYAALATGLKTALNVPAPQPKFDAARVAQKIEQKIAVEPTAWEEEGTLFKIEINFGPNQKTFPESTYVGDYQKALELSQTYGGALVVVEGHSDPLGILKAREEGKPDAEVAQMEQVAKNLSLERANAVRQSFMDYAKKHGMKVDASTFHAVGMGIRSPKYKIPTTKEQWAANRRVVFVIKQVEAELEEFTPLATTKK